MHGSKTLRMVGWVLSCLIAAFLIFASAMGKFVEWEGKAEMFAELGWTEALMFKIGFVEVAIAVLFLIPRTAFVAAILLAAYLGGAVATHVRVGDPFYMPIIVALVAWIALGMRQPDIFRLAMGESKRSEKTAPEHGFS